MTLSDRIQQLINQNNTSQSELEKTLGFGKGTISKWKGSTAPSADKLQKIAEYFGVTIDYLMTGKDWATKEELELTTRDKRDIAKDLDRIMGEIANGEDGPLFYNGQPLDPEDMIFLSKAIEAALADAKKKNKITYNSYKNRPKK